MGKKKKYAPNELPVDVFDEKYNPIEKAGEDGEEGKFETYGEDMEYVLEYKDKHGETHIWTQVDGNDGDVWIVAGLHYVHRICYYITKEEWSSDDEQYYLGLEG